MALTFTYASGSPPAWKVWLALEHKQIPYELRLVSFQAGDLKKPDFLAKNPRGKVPVIEHEGLVLWESSAILEYLEERFPERPLMPASLPERARARRLAVESDTYFYPAVRRLLAQTMYRPDGAGDEAEIAAAREEVLRECARFDAELSGAFFAGDQVSHADFAVYPVTALLRRLDLRQPENGIGAAMGTELAAFMGRIEALPYFAKTVPPHWKEPLRKPSGEVERRGGEERHACVRVGRFPHEMRQLLYGSAAVPACTFGACASIRPCFRRSCCRPCCCR